MGVINRKFVALAIIAIASTATGCTNVIQNPINSSADSVSNTDHSMMNHSMEMDLGAADVNYDLRFIDGMMMHHQGAVIMATEALEKSKRPEIKQLANNIIAAQKKEIAQMKQWRTAWYPAASQQPVAYGGANKSVMPMSAKQHESMMMSQDLGAADDKFDLRFLNAMIPHHEGALVMAKDAISKSTRSEVKQLNQNILTSQQAEITQMQQWRKAWYNK
ncbi:DUF305 domain-containing protein [Synechocystis sp. PCC 7509]|uniref:DUF305 domain-containing protein n=1 Tax=Synechocystis sp. PCC 7509 TaxID=927677 RepID=UPI0002AC40BC|nr:DUF305 domain-containing protein [Synechocystis sp. PCC 7509]